MQSSWAHIYEEYEFMMAVAEAKNKQLFKLELPYLNPIGMTVSKEQ